MVSSHYLRVSTSCMWSVIAVSGIAGLELRLREVDGDISMPVILVSDNMILPSLDPEVGDILQTYAASSLSSSKSSFLLLAPTEDVSEEMIGEGFAAGKSRLLLTQRVHQCYVERERERERGAPFSLLFA